MSVMSNTLDSVEMTGFGIFGLTRNGWVRMIAVSSLVKPCQAFSPHLGERTERVGAMCSCEGRGVEKEQFDVWGTKKKLSSRDSIACLIVILS
jgi:hypothetical protein